VFLGSKCPGLRDKEHRKRYTTWEEGREYDAEEEPEKQRYEKMMGRKGWADVRSLLILTPGR
jgi:hypothetical protein